MFRLMVINVLKYMRKLGYLSIGFDAAAHAA